MLHIRALRTSSLLAAVLLVAGCSGSYSLQASSTEAVPRTQRPSYTADVPVSRAPYEDVAVNWKHRLDQAYVYLEHHGDYRAIGSSFQRLLTALEAQDLTPTGPLFALYYDDPGSVAIESLQARVCMPVAPQTAVRGGLRFDVLPSTTVAYALVAGPYADVPRAYPKILEYLQRHSWTVAGPIRELYVNPEAAAVGAELLTEVQVPWRGTNE